MLRVVNSGESEPDRMEAEDRARKRFFAAHVAHGTPIVKAMRLSSFEKPSKPGAAALLSDPYVISEMERHYEVLRSSLRNSREAVIAQLDDAIEMAQNLENPAATVAAVVAKAKILGLLNTPAQGNMPSKITVEWGDESHETIYEKTNPLLIEAMAEAVGPAPSVVALPSESGLRSD